jgi:hypothetical protein
MWLRWITAALLVPTAIYTAATVVFNAPASPVQIRLAPLASGILGQYFTQDWQLFGPTPGNSAQMLVVEAKVRSAGGKITMAPAIDVEYQIDRLPRTNRLLPTKVPTVVLAFQETFAGYTNLLVKIDKSQKSQRRILTKILNQRYSVDLQELDRFLSAESEILYPGKTVVSVRALFAQRKIVPYSDRYLNPQPVEPATLILRTMWMPFVPDVTN